MQISTPVCSEGLAWEELPSTLGSHQEDRPWQAPGSLVYLCLGACWFRGGWGQLCWERFPTMSRWQRGRPGVPRPVRQVHTPPEPCVLPRSQSLVRLLESAGPNSRPVAGKGSCLLSSLLHASQPVFPSLFLPAWMGSSGRAGPEAASPVASEEPPRPRQGSSVICHELLLLAPGIKSPYFPGAGRPHHSSLSQGAWQAKRRTTPRVQSTMP